MKKQLKAIIGTILICNGVELEVLVLIEAHLGIFKGGELQYLFDISLFCPLLIGIGISLFI